MKILVMQSKDLPITRDSHREYRRLFTIRSVAQYEQEKKNVTLTTNKTWVIKASK